jgi:YidC/Oxa1 family membrane protein insertase
MTQQFYVIRRMPAPGSAAEKAYHARLAKRGKPVPGAAPKDAAAGVVGEEPVSPVQERGQRQQPKSKKRSKKKGGPNQAPGTSQP